MEIAISTPAIQIADQNAAFGGIPTPVIVGNRDEDEQHDHGSIVDANEDAIGFDVDNNNDIEGNEIISKANGASQSLMQSWDKPSQLFDMFDMTQEERKEAERIYRLRRQHEASVAFACGSGKVSPPRNAPIIANSD